VPRLPPVRQPGRSAARRPAGIVFALTVPATRSQAPRAAKPTAFLGASLAAAKGFAGSKVAAGAKVRRINTPSSLSPGF
jgi:hypothetical protein